MKKIILTVLAITLLSCSKDEVAPIVPVIPVAQTCKVEKYTEVRKKTYSNAGALISDTGFQENGTKEAYSKNCDDCGKILPGGSTLQTTTTITELRYVAKCK